LDKVNFDGKDTGREGGRNPKREVRGYRSEGV